MQQNECNIEQTLIWIRSYFAQSYVSKETAKIEPIVHLHKSCQRVTLQQRGNYRTIQVLDWLHPERTCMMHVNHQPVLQGATLFQDQKDELPFFILDALTGVLRHPQEPILDQMHIRKVLYRTSRLEAAIMNNTQKLLHDRLLGYMYQLWKKDHPVPDVQDYDDEDFFCARTRLIDAISMKP